MEARLRAGAFPIPAAALAEPKQMNWIIRKIVSEWARRYSPVALGAVAFVIFVAIAPTRSPSISQFEVPSIGVSSPTNVPQQQITGPSSPPTQPSGSQNGATTPPNTLTPVPTTTGPATPATAPGTSIPSQTTPSQSSPSPAPTQPPPNGPPPCQLSAPVPPVPFPVPLTTVPIPTPVPCPPSPAPAGMQPIAP